MNEQVSVELIGKSAESVPLGRRIRRFYDDLFLSRTIRVLESELQACKLDKLHQIDALRAEKRELQERIKELEKAIMPGRIHLPPPGPAPKLETQRTSWDQIVAERVRENERKAAEESAEKEN
jgi:hypothetical protein